MTFKEFLKNEELNGIFGPVAKVGGGENNMFKIASQNVKSPLGRGDAIKKMMSAGPKVTKPARPAGPGAGPNKPMTIPSVLKSLK